MNLCCLRSPRQAAPGIDRRDGLDLSAANTMQNVEKRTQPANRIG